MDEGRALRRLLDANGKKPADLARACGVSDSAVTRYLSTKHIRDRAWKTVRAGLIVLKIDYSSLRPDAISMSAEPIEDFRPQVLALPQAQIDLVYKILDSSEASQKFLHVWLNGRMSLKK